MKPKNPPPATYSFGYKTLPKSGNRINGLGVEEKVQAKHVFHYTSSDNAPWQALDEFFSFINPWGVVKHMLANAWQLRRQDGPVKSRQIKVDNPSEMSVKVKSLARKFGADLVGITEVVNNAVYEGHEVPYKYAICIGVGMNRTEMSFVPQKRAAVEVMKTYRKISRIAVELSEMIRAMGWEAKAYGNPNSTDILQIPLAINAGLGQLGKHGSTISSKFGSNFRLALVATDLPLSTDSPVDIGVDDICMTCQRCVKDCPPNAIYKDKQLIRGEKKWYVDFDKCIPYFVKTLGCAICIEVCPWSETGRGQWLTDMVMKRRKLKDRVPGWSEAAN